jgi:flagellar protein FliS
LSLNASQKYIRDEILSASPQKLIVLLYGGAIKNLEEAKKHIHDEDPYHYTKHYTKAEAIIAELTGAVKTESNPEVGINLLRLYDYMYQALLDSHAKRDEEKLSSVIEMLRDMRNTWVQAIEKAEDEPVVSDSTPTATASAATNIAPPPKRPSLSFEA